MRADRIVSLLLLLQTRGRLTARELAAELEVSVRTVYRDVEALIATGVPIYADHGPSGGYQLLAGYRTRLTGLTSDQAESLFLVGLPGPAAELGLGAELAAAELRLLAALPDELRVRAERLRDRFHLDVPGWFRVADPAPELGTVAAAVWTQRPLRLGYRRWKEPRDVVRVVAPLGLVLKAGTWYLVAAQHQPPDVAQAHPEVDGESTGGRGGGLRTYRVAHIQTAMPLPGLIDRPEGFDLAAAWQELASAFEAAVIRGEATIRISPRGLWRLPALVLGGAAMAKAAHDSAGPPDADGWVEAVVPIESAPKAHADMLSLGADVEVLGPPELRAMMAATITALATRYPST